MHVVLLAQHLQPFVFIIYYIAAPSTGRLALSISCIWGCCIASSLDPNLLYGCVRLRDVLRVHRTYIRTKLGRPSLSGIMLCVSC